MTLRINDNGIDRDMTAEEAAEYEAYQLATQKEIAARQKALEAVAAAKASASAKLAALGLTPAEIAALVS